MRDFAFYVENMIEDKANNLVAGIQNRVDK